MNRSQLQSMLLMITLVSLTVAAVSSAIAWRLYRDERRRSDARVAALAGEIVVAADPPDPGHGRSAAARGIETGGAPAGAMFASAATGRAGGRRVGPAVAVAGLALTALAGGLLVVGGSDTPAEPREAARPPLELLALRHAQQGDQITITGLVRNPAAAAPVTQLTAVVFFFDASGAFLASGRAPLEFPRLAPGDQSAFQMALRVPAGVSRYRVSFRQPEGGIVRHVDRRTGVDRQEEN